MTTMAKNHHENEISDFSQSLSDSVIAQFDIFIKENEAKNQKHCVDKVVSDCSNTIKTTNVEIDLKNAQLKKQNLVQQLEITPTKILKNVYEKNDTTERQKRLLRISPPKKASKKVCTYTSTPKQTLRNKILSQNELAIEIIQKKKRTQADEQQISTSIETLALPEGVIECYKKSGISELYPWQAECLSIGEVMNGHNLIYSAPTSSGKTLVAEILMLKTVLEQKKKALMILPFVSVAREKMFYLKSTFKSLGVSVEGFIGSRNAIGGFKKHDILICTIEKANSLINKLMEEGDLSELGILVVDELHMIGDPSRGYLIELLLTKIIYCSQRFKDSSVQIIGMSATIPDIEVLARWLKAECYITDYRPVPLSEYFKFGHSVRKMSDLSEVRVVNSDHLPINYQKDDLIPLILEIVCEGGGVLTFCPTKIMCEKLSDNIAREFWNIGKPDSAFLQSDDRAKTVCHSLRSNVDSVKLKEVYELLCNCSAGLDKILARVIPFGIAYHHAGLTIEERDIIEDAFRKGVIRVLISTSTLSSGVNLPARRVIITTPIFYGKLINFLTYKQMVGRAGRKNVDTEGDSFLLCQENEFEKAKLLTNSKINPISSCLHQTSHNLSSALKRAILEILVSGVAETHQEVIEYMSCTLLFILCMHSGSIDENSIEVCFKFLNDMELIRPISDETGKYTATQLGKAILASSLSPDEGLQVFEDLGKARSNFILENDLHIIYQVTPIYLSEQWSKSIDWNEFYSVWENLPNDVRKVGRLVGVKESFMVKAACGHGKTGSKRQLRDWSIHVRFYAALALSDLINEIPLMKVCSKFHFNKGTLQSLQQNAATFAGMVTIFCKKLNWLNLELLLTHYQSRLNFGIQRELCDLMRISLLNKRQARALYNSGFEMVSNIANAASFTAIEAVLRNAIPFESAKMKDDETKQEASTRNEARMIWLTNLKGVSESEAAKIIIDEAREIVQKDLGVEYLIWNNVSKTSLKKQSIIKDEIVEHESNTKETDYEDMEIEKIEDGKLSLSLDTEKIDKINSTREVSTLKPEISEHSNNNAIDNTGLEELDNDGGSDDLVLNHSSVHECTDLMKEFENSLTLHDFSFNHSDKRIYVSNASKHVLTCSTPNVQQPSSICDGINSESESSFLKKLQKCYETQQDHHSISDKIIVKDTRHLSNQPECTTDDPMDDESESSDISWNTSNIWSPSSKIKHASMISNPFDDDRCESPVPKSFLIKESEDLFGDSTSFTDCVNLSSEVRTNNESVDLFDDSQSNCIKHPNDCLKTKITLDSQYENSMNLSEDFIDTSDVVLPSPETKSVLLKNRSKRQIQNFEFINVDGIVQAFDELAKELRKSLEFSFSLFDKCEPHRNKKFPLKIDEMTYVIGLKPYKFFFGTLYNNNRLKDRSTWCLFNEIFQDSLKTIVCFDVKVIHQRLLSFNLGSSSKWFDIKVASWLIDHDSKEKTLFEINDELFPNNSDVSDLIRNDLNSLSLEEFVSNEIVKLSPSLSIYDKLGSILKSLDLLDCFYGIEVPAVINFSRMELAGFGLNEQTCKNIVAKTEELLKLLENKAFKIVRRKFNMLSPKEVSSILFGELRLKCDVIDDQCKKPSDEFSSRTLKLLKKKPINSRWPRTKKANLEKLAKQHQLPKIILEWRKLSCTLNKVLYPLVRLRNFDSANNMFRVHRPCLSHTATGRLSMAEPNLQNIPKDFGITSLEDVDCEEISLRSMFVPFNGAVFVSADYSQLELRLLAHLSNDKNLVESLSCGGDVFKNMASKIWKCSVEMVSNTQRQHAKQICYGIIYGMGVKLLMENLSLENEDQAKQFMLDFYQQYKGVQEYTKVVVDNCKNYGYVRTIAKRRRYLPSICDTENTVLQQQAERQAVNTTIQGSAADVVKTAMNGIQCAVERRCKKCNKQFDSKASDCTHDCRLVLQVHDELIYEVNELYVNDFSKIIKHQMESAYKLKVPLLVRLRFGYSWGKLEDF